MRGRQGFRPRSVGAVAAIMAFATTVSVAPAEAARDATKAEAKQIKRGFLKGRDVKTKLKAIRVSTVDPRFAAVTYSVTLPEEATSRGLAGRLVKGYPAPTPAVLKEGKKGGKWKTVPKAPKKVKKDLKAKAKSEIRISGEVDALLKRAAACSEGSGFYGAGVYDPAGDVYLSVEMPTYGGPGVYPALGVKSLASLAVGNKAGPPQYSTGQSNDAFAPSGVIYVDAAGWGLIEAGMARFPDDSGFPPLNVDVSGYWVCG